MQFLEAVRSSTARRAVRAFLALAIVAWLVHSVGLEAIAGQFSRADWAWLPLATALLAVDGFAKARNWQHLLSATLGTRSIRYRRVLSWHFGGGFLGAVVPSSAGTDACRVLLALRGLGGHAAPCAASILTVNALGLFVGSLLGIIGILALAHIGELPRLLRPALLVFLAMVAGLPIGYAMLASKRSSARALIDKASRRRSFRRGLARFLDALLVFERANVRLPGFLVFAAGGLLAQAGMFALTAAAVDIALPWVVWLVVVPLTRIVALVPVSVADFGLIQAAHVSLLSLFGVPAAQSLALSALFAVEGLAVHATLGAAAFMLGTRGSPPARDDARPAGQRFEAAAPASPSGEPRELNRSS